MTHQSVRDIKRAQKERMLLKHVADLFHQAALDDDRIQGLFVNRVALSADKSKCTVYFYSVHGKKYFEEKLEFLKLYKPSLRKAIASAIKSRYVPDFTFTFDDQYEKQEKVEQLFEQIKVEDESWRYCLPGLYFYAGAHF